MTNREAGANLAVSPVVAAVVAAVQGWPLGLGAEEAPRADLRSVVAAAAAAAIAMALE